MFCVKCGKELSSDSLFCGYCGAPAADKTEVVPLAQQPAPPNTAQPVQATAQEAVVSAEGQAVSAEQPAQSDTAQSVQSAAKEAAVSAEGQVVPAEQPAPPNTAQPVQATAQEAAASAEGQAAPVEQPTQPDTLAEAQAAEPAAASDQQKNAATQATVQEQAASDEKVKQEPQTPVQSVETVPPKTEPSAEHEILSGISSEEKPFAPETPPETVTCPKCKEETDAAKDVCEKCGAAVKPKKKSKKPFVIVLVILLVLALGGGAAWYFLFNQPASSEPSQPEASTSEEDTRQPEETTEEITEATLAEPEYQASKLYGVWQIGGDDGRIIAFSKQGSFFQLSNGNFYCGTFAPTDDKLVLSYTNGDETVYGVNTDDGFVLSFDGEYVALDLIATLDENTNPLLGVWYCDWNDEAVLFADGGMVWASNGLKSSYVYNAFELTVTIGDNEPVACQPSDTTLKVDFEGKGTFFEYKRIK